MAVLIVINHDRLRCIRRCHDAQTLAWEEGHHLPPAMISLKSRNRACCSAPKSPSILASRSCSSTTWRSTPSLRAVPHTRRSERTSALKPAEALASQPGAKPFLIRTRRTSGSLAMRIRKACTPPRVSKTAACQSTNKHKSHTSHSPDDWLVHNLWLYYKHRIVLNVRSF